MLFRYLLRHGDRALVLAQRLCEWVAHAPTLEEEVALANIGLDLLGQATELLGYAGEVEGAGRNADALAYGRSDREYLNVLLVEQPNGDFAQTMVRQLLHDAYAVALWESIGNSTDARLASWAAKWTPASRYHLRHAREWVVRLGDGTDHSHGRAQRALDDLWRWTGELFETDEVEDELVAQGVAPDPNTLRSRWLNTVENALAEATLVRPPDGFMQTGGRTGRHTEAMSFLLAEMQVLPRSHPGASW